MNSHMYRYTHLATIMQSNIERPPCGLAGFCDRRLETRAHEAHIESPVAQFRTRDSAPGYVSRKFAYFGGS